MRICNDLNTIVSLAFKGAEHVAECGGFADLMEKGTTSCQCDRRL